MPIESVAPDRRQRRRNETITEVLDIAVEIMNEHGVAGLSVGEVARRLGIRPPSLYVYFPSKDALYDALFERGAQLLLETMRPAATSVDVVRLDQTLLPAADTFVRWSVEHPAYSQLLFWRPVPGFAPSAQAYGPAVELVELGVDAFATLQANGLIRPDADVSSAYRDWTVLLAGVVSQQLSNAPDETFDEGRFTRAVPDLVAMFIQYYGSPTHAQPSEEARRDRSR